MVANHPGMTDQTSSNIARDGAAKRPQVNFPLAHGMKDQTEASQLKGISPDSPGFGSAPDASSPNPLDPSPKVKKFGEVKAAWDMKDANGDSINNEVGKQVLSEAALLGRK
jgi:hypothetical protein